MQSTQPDIDYKERYEQHSALSAELSDLKIKFEKLEAEKTQLEIEKAYLTYELNQIRKMVFGSRRERFIAAADATKKDIQLALDLEVDTIAQCKITNATKVEYIRTRSQLVTSNPQRHPGRMKLPEHLRRETFILQPEQDITGYRKIGEDITEILDYIPSELYVRQYIRPKYEALLADGFKTIITASLPGRIMEKFMAGEGLLAQMIVDKYVDHLPINRQRQRFERMGVNIAQSTTNDWFRAVLNQLSSLYEAHKRITLDTGYLEADETPIKVQDGDKKGTTHLGYYWVYRNIEQNLVLFDYRPGRGREGPNDILKDFKGYLQTDGYSAYNSFDKSEGITLIHCMAHARRKFYDALNNDKALAEHALGLFGKLYDIERQIKEGGLAGNEVIALRQQQAVPVLNELKVWMQEEYPKIPNRKSPIAVAIAYCLPRWEKLCIYTTDARLRIDNNLVENDIRPIALGRKNYLFAGSHDAAQRAAMIYSLLTTCRLHGISPYEWLKDVLQRMHIYKTSSIDILLPQNWTKLPDWDEDLG